MMDNDQVELAAKDVFVLMDVPEPAHLDVENKRQVTRDYQDNENESKISLSSNERMLVEAITGPSVIDVTPPEEFDYSSSDSITKNEFEEERWYNPNSNEGLEFDSLKETLRIIRITTPVYTPGALCALRTKYKISDTSFQNMFIKQNGLEVLINLLDCSRGDCMVQALSIIHDMSSYYGVQSQLCDLNAVKPLLGILLSKNNPGL